MIEPTDKQKAEAFDQLKGWLRSGACVSAVDPSENCLTLQDDGTWYGGLAVSTKNPNPPTVAHVLDK